MKRQDFEPCAICGEGVMNHNQIQFYRITINSMVIDLNEVRQVAGLETMMGSPALADVFSGGDLAKTMESKTVLVCGLCVYKGLANIGHLIEKDGSE